MRVLIYTLVGKDIGMGHWYRCRVLADDLERAGHKVKIASNNHDQLRALGFPSGPRLSLLFAEYLPDYVVFDLPEKLDTYVTGMCHSYGVKTCSLLDEDYADVIYAQDDASRIILRPELTQLKGQANRDLWLVFGGTFDPMGLLDYFSRYGKENAWMVEPPGYTKPEVRKPGQIGLRDIGDALPQYIRNCGRACIAFGMIAWELAACGKPQYVFSLDEEHLQTALKMQDAGLAQVWPKPGLPSPKEFSEFVGRPFVPTGVRPDGRGGIRLVQLLEKTQI